MDSSGSLLRSQKSNFTAKFCGPEQHATTYRYYLGKGSALDPIHHDRKLGLLGSARPDAGGAREHRRRHGGIICEISEGFVARFGTGARIGKPLFRRLGNSTTHASELSNGVVELGLGRFQYADFKTF